MNMRSVFALVLLCVLVSSLAGCAGDGVGLTEAGDPIKKEGEPEVVTIPPTKDNTLYENGTGAFSNGAGETLFAGVTGPTGSNSIRRAVLSFDIAGDVPSGATIVDAVLTLHLSRKPGGTGPQVHTIHVVLADWGEGTSVAGGAGGFGGASTTGDATWIHTFFNTATWATPGGDISATVSATQTCDDIAFYSWTDTQLVADVQSFLDSPSTNFGWAVFGNEAANQTARRFDSRENSNATFRPELKITYTTAP